MHRPDKKNERKNETHPHIESQIKLQYQNKSYSNFEYRSSFHSIDAERIWHKTAWDWRFVEFNS